MKFSEFCPHCSNEVEIKFKGFVIYQCPSCSNELLPCSICDACTDREVKIYAQSCLKCPFERRKNAI